MAVLQRCALIVSLLVAFAAAQGFPQLAEGRERLPKPPLNRLPVKRIIPTGLCREAGGQRELSRNASRRFGVVLCTLHGYKSMVDRDDEKTLNGVKMSKSTPEESRQFQPASLTLYLGQVKKY